MISESDAPGARGEPPGHVNDQAQSGNADPGNNGLGHQPRELPSQASAHAVEDLATLTGVEDTKGDRADHGHGAAAKNSSTIDTPAITIADSDAPGGRGEPPGHVNDQPQQLENADPGNNGLGISPVKCRAKPPCRRQRTFHRSPQSRTPRETMRPTLTVPPRRNSSTIDTTGAAVAHTDSSGSQGAAPGEMNDQFHFAYTNPDTSQSPELPSQAASHPAVEIPASTTDNSDLGHGNDFNPAALPNAVEDAKGSDKAQIRGAAAKTCRRSMSPARRSRITTPRASEVRPLSTGMTSSILRMRTRATMA